MYCPRCLRVVPTMIHTNADRVEHQCSVCLITILVENKPELPNLSLSHRSPRKGKKG